MRITLNLATRPFADTGPAVKRLRISMGVMAVLCIGFGIGLHFLHSAAERARAREHSLDGSISSVTRERQQYVDMMRQPPNAALLTEVDSLNQLFDEKSFSWTLAMEDLETVLPGGVQASSLEPVRAKDGKITLHLRVIGPRDREVDMIQNFEHSRRFLLPRIVSENAAEASENQARNVVEPVSPSNRFNFEILADYNPATPTELTATEKAGPADERKREKKAAKAGPVAHPQGSARPNPRQPQPLAPPAPGQPRAPYSGTSRPPGARLLPQRANPSSNPNPGGPQ